MICSSKRIQEFRDAIIVGKHFKHSVIIWCGGKQTDVTAQIVGDGYMMSRSRHIHVFRSSLIQMFG